MVPNLRFTNLNKLVKVRLGDICTITGGYAFDSLKMTQKGEYQIINIIDHLIQKSSEISLVSAFWYNKIVLPDIHFNYEVKVYVQI